MSNTDYAPEVVRGAKRLHRAFYKRKRGPWEGVITPWEFLGETRQGEFLRLAAIFHAAEYVHDGDPDKVAAEAARELDGLKPQATSVDEFTAYMARRYAEYNDKYLDKD